MISLDFLEKVEAFQGLSDAQLTAVQSCCDLQEYRRDDRFFIEGAPADRLWIVVEGQVDLRFDLPGRPTSDVNTISALTEGKIFGWSSLVPPFRYRLSAYCASRTCKVATVDKDCLLQRFEEDPVIGHKVMANVAAVVGERFHQLQDEMSKRRGHDIMNSW